MYKKFWEERLNNARITGDQINADCPICDKTRHFYANINTGQFDCKLCGITGNAITYLRVYEKKDNKQIAECLNSYGMNENNHIQPIPQEPAPKKVFEQSLVDYYVSNLPEERLKEFVKERDLPVEILKKYRLGLDKEGNFTLPVYDEEGRIRDIRRKQIGKDTISSTGAEVFLFGIQDLLSNDRVFITEGEWSKMALEVQGYASVGVPGASVFKDEWSPYFQDKEVYIVYDLDSGGKQGTKKVIDKLSSIAKEIRVIKLPQELGEGKDIRDFFNNGGTKERFEELIKGAEIIEGEKQKITESYKVTDLGNAERLVDRHSKNLRFCHPWRKWLVWDGWCWAVDVTAEVWRYGIETVRHIYAEAEAMEDKGLREGIAKHALASESEAKIKAMLSLAEKQEEIPVKPEELDRDLWLLNVLNGTIDLRTGGLREHCRKDLITKLAPVNYNIEALCPKWLEFLNKIMMGNEALAQFLQRVVGYCLTGKTGEHKLFFLFGSGQNGKTTFLKTLQGIMGDYVIKADSELLLAKPVGSHTTYIADLQGKRLAITVEIQEGRRLAEALTKELTGSDTITARRMRQDNINFEPTHKIILAANHKPIIHETTLAIWRRINLIPFNFVISEKDKIKDYHEILLNEEKDGIFRWALEGCKQWQETGLREPNEVLAATKDYRTEMDILADFLTDCCIIGQGEETTNKELRETYEQWCQKNGDKAISAKAFSTRLQEKGFIKKRTGIARSWKGIGLQVKLNVTGYDG